MCYKSKLKVLYEYKDAISIKNCILFSYQGYEKTACWLKALISQIQLDIHTWNKTLSKSAHGIFFQITPRMVNSLSIHCYQRWSAVLPGAQIKERKSGPGCDPPQGLVTKPTNITNNANLLIYNPASNTSLIWHLKTVKSI